MIARPRTSPGNTIGSEATLSSSHRPGIFVFTTIQQITEVTSMIRVALQSERTSVFHTVRPRFGYEKMYRYGSCVRLWSACHDGIVSNFWYKDPATTEKG